MRYVAQVILGSLIGIAMLARSVPGPCARTAARVLISFTIVLAFSGDPASTSASARSNSRSAYRKMWMFTEFSCVGTHPTALSALLAFSWMFFLALYGPPY